MGELGGYCINSSEQRVFAASWCCRQSVGDTIKGMGGRRVRQKFIVVLIHPEKAYFVPVYRNIFTQPIFTSLIFTVVVVSRKKCRFIINFKHGFNFWHR